jgi:integrase
MLESLTPEDAVEAYLNERESELSESSLRNQRYRLGQFLDRCEEAGLEDMNEMTGRRAYEYKQWRSEGIKPITLKTSPDTLRVFLRFCERIEAVPQGVHQKVSPPSITGTGDQNDAMIDTEAVDQILGYLDRWEYANPTYAAFYLLWHTGIRIGSVGALDLDDYNSEEGYVEIHHRPETGTQLKNKERGECHVNLSRDVCDVLDGYVEFNHGKTADEHGRMPLLGTSYGRPTHDDPSEDLPGDLALRVHQRVPAGPRHRRLRGDGTPSNEQVLVERVPNAIRRGSITHHLKAGVPKEAVSDRMNVSDEVLEKDYDARTAGKRRSQRSSSLDISEGSDGEIPRRNQAHTEQFGTILIEFLIEFSTRRRRSRRGSRSTRLLSKSTVSGLGCMLQ